VTDPQPDPFPLADYTDELAERLRSLVPQALQAGEVDSIHQARVTTRRLRAALDLLGPVMPRTAQKPIAKTLRKLRKQLGPLRDLDVMIGHLGELARYKRHAAAVGWLETHLKDRRKKATEQALQKAAPAKTLGKLGAWWGVREEISDAREAVDSLLASSLNQQIDEFATAADSMIATPRAADVTSEASDSVATAADPHAVRIVGKLLRYTLEMAKVEGHALPGSVMRGFKKMQESLGMWHDFVVLTDTAMEISVEEMLAVTDAAMLHRVLDLASFSLKRAELHLAKFTTLWQERGKEITAAIHEAFPLTKDVSTTTIATTPVSGSQTGLDPVSQSAPADSEVSESADPEAA
jgi:CHAD domain-containing protein